MLALSVLGCVLSALKWGWRGALGYAVGAVISIWNYGRLEALADAISRQYAPQPEGAPSAAPRTPRAALGLVLRYALVVLALYVIVKYLGVNVMAALIGLFTGFVAVFAEALIAHAGNKQ
jgi:hypothetical protein